MRRMAFYTWLKLVDTQIQRQVGLSRDDLPDWNYADAYAAGYSATKAAVMAIRAARREMGL